MGVLRRGYLAMLGSVFGLQTHRDDRQTNSQGRISRISAHNLDTEPHTIHMLVLKEAEPVFWQSARLDAAVYEEPEEQNDEATTTSEPRRVGSQVWDDPVENDGRYRIFFRLDNDQTWREADTRDKNHCFAVLARITRDASLEIRDGTCW